MQQKIHEEHREGVTLDALTPEWQVYQLKKGHRFSNDDKLCAWRAAEHAGWRKKCLDLGSGIGSVGLSVLWRLPDDATLCMVEAQEESVMLCRKSVMHNKLNERVRIVHMDLRKFCIDPEESSNKYELITGSPPYIPPANGIASKHTQKAHCRLELRGGLDDYCKAAAHLLAPRGRFIFVMTAADARCKTAPQAAGLVVLERFEYKFKGNRSQAHIATIVCARLEDVQSDFSPPEPYTMILRQTDGKRTLDYRAWQEYMQLKPTHQNITLDQIKHALADLRMTLQSFEQHPDTDGNELRDAIQRAEDLGITSTPGSEELCTAKRALLRLSSTTTPSSS